MAIPFSRTVRSMNHDRFRPGLVVIIFLGLILLAWMIWLFTGNLPIFASSQDLKVGENGNLQVQFPAESFSGLTTGQTGTFISSIQTSPSSAPLEVQIMAVPFSSREGVEVYVFATEKIPSNVTGTVKILVGEITPAMLVWSSIGN